MRCTVCGIMFLTVFGLAANVLWGAPKNVTLLVIPSRPSVVQLAFDMVHLRAITVVAYHGEAKTTEPVLHVWSGSGWQYVSLPDFADKQFINTGVNQAIVVGDDQTVPAVLLRSMAWCSDIQRLPTLNVADLINSLDRVFQFREREWKWLAGRYDLTLTDLNAERRNRNPYNTPRSKLPLEKREFKQEKGDIAPAELIEGTTADTPASAVKPETIPDEKPPK